jgi:uncharacterized protein (TIGR01244 family)
MKGAACLGALGSIVVALSACRYEPGPGATAPAAGTTPAASVAELLPNAREPLPGVLTGGQPSREQLEALAAAGYRTVVNLRAEGEEMPVGSSDVTALGMRYVHIPVKGAEDLGAGNAAELGALLADPAARPMAIHCASGNRVGALLALEAATVERKSPEEALALGRAAGLGRMEPAVREKLGLPSAPR